MLQVGGPARGVHGRYQNSDRVLRVDRKTKRTIVKLEAACRAVAARENCPFEDACEILAELT